ncbi:cytochrome c oxidase subunit II [Nocardioides sp. AE5]|uniref:aa3-type cytochrome oxidase subunit II n=1 Tax=Nocardioides sp. AE5 TaxID=2962573 RepID=UPI002882349E|nr:cytochrome c oxidase subunit II [Nocardioides sp. AE5]MDT0201172.1 cytochrome c oxidase subunit II [Nocardioides sp. AE5]
MGLQLPKRVQRVAAGTMLGSSLLLVGSCSAEDKAQAERWAMPATSPATEQAVHIAELWKWAWIALLITGAVVWFLIFFASWRFRRRSEDEIPVQTRYNLPVEVFYTIFPVIMVLVFFFHTVEVQNKILEHDPDPDHVVQVVGQQWSWTFNHSDDPKDLEGPVHYTSGTASKIPTLVLEVDKTTEFKLSSPDVIHSFWIPAFLMKMDVIPGQAGEERNSFQVTPTKVGTFKGKCAELCGTYHSRMLFDVKVVTADEYAAYLAQLEADGFTADAPLLGGSDAVTQANANTNHGGEE